MGDRVIVLHHALDCTRKGGKILFFAEFPDEVTIPINPNILYRREIDLMGSYSSSYRIQTLAADIILVVMQSNV